MKKSFLISTGGSGGHVIPAMTLYEHLSKDFNIIISIDKRGLRYLDKDVYSFKVIDTPKLNNIFFLPYNFIIVLFLTIKSFLLLKINKIEKIFSTGGYMSIPLILAAKILRLNIYLLEPNKVLGRSNKYFLNSCKKIFCYSENIKNFPDQFKDKMAIIKPLIRKNVYKLNSASNIKKRFTLLIIGGSQGANIFDKSLKNKLVNVSKKNSIKIIQQTNEKNIQYLVDFYTNNNIENKIFSYEKDLSSTICNTDLCITRGGASTLAELSFLNVPFIVVPLPTSKDNHQFENASFYKTNNSCWVIDQNSFEEKIEGILDGILKDKRDYLKKKENLQKLNYQNTWINVNQKILGIINEN